MTLHKPAALAPRPGTIKLKQREIKGGFPGHSLDLCVNMIMREPSRPSAENFRAIKKHFFQPFGHTSQQWQLAILICTLGHEGGASDFPGTSTLQVRILVSAHHIALRAQGETTAQVLATQSPTAKVRAKRSSQFCMALGDRKAEGIKNMTRK